MKESMVGMDDVTVKLLVDMHIAQGDLAAVRVNPQGTHFPRFFLNFDYMPRPSLPTICVLNYIAVMFLWRGGWVAMWLGVQ